MQAVSPMLRRRTAALALSLGLAMLSGTAAAQALTVRKAGELETVTSWQRDACAKRDAPDTPARAFRDAGQGAINAYIKRQGGL